MTHAIQFFIAVITWSLIGQAVLMTGAVHPVALFVVWLIGFVWIAGYIASGTRAADHLLKVWLGMMAGIVALGVLMAQVLS